MLPSCQSFDTRVPIPNGNGMGTRARCSAVFLLFLRPVVLILVILLRLVGLERSGVRGRIAHGCVVLSLVLCAFFGGRIVHVAVILSPASMGSRAFCASATEK